MKSIKVYIKTHLINALFSAFLIIGLISISGCASDEFDSDASEAIEVPVKIATVIKTDEEKKGGNLNIYLPKDVTVSNPFRTDSDAMADIYSIIYEKLVYIDNNNKPQPMLAESWEVSEDGKTYTVALRSDVYFSDGSKLTSDDVVYTYNYIKGTSSGVTKYKDVIQSISSIEKVDDTHFKVVGVKPGMNALYALNFPVLSSSYNNSSTPMGTGPYKVSTYSKNSKMVLVPNTKWWKPQPYIETITAICYNSESDALEAFANGKIDIIDTESVSSDIYRKRASADRYKLPTTKLNYLMINTSKSNLSNKVFRQALDYAIDKKKLINNVFISHADPADQPLPPTDWRYNISYTQYDYDYDKAVEMFKSLNITQKENVDETCGLKTYSLMKGSSQVSFKILIIDDETDTKKKEVAKNIKSDLEKIGISVEIESKKYDKYIAALKSGDFDIALCSVILKNDMDISGMLTNNSSALYYINYGKYYNSTLMSYINAYVAATKDSEIIKNSEAFQELFLDENPFICLNFEARTLLVNDNVGGIEEVFTDNVFNGINEWYIK